MQNDLRYTLMTIDQALDEVNRRLALQDRPPISLRRLQAIARKQHDEAGVGYQFGRTKVWLFWPQEIDYLVPGKPGKPRKPKP